MTFLPVIFESVETFRVGIAGRGKKLFSFIRRSNTVPFIIEMYFHERLVLFMILKTKCPDSLRKAG
jgi:hypothetical protein